MFIKILAVVAVIIVGVLIAAATRPNQFRYERSIEISATPEQIFPFINDLKEWPKWSPYDKIDPNMKKTLSGPNNSVGPGATLDWEGNSQAGTGHMEITSSTPPGLIQLKLIMMKPMAANNDVEFKIQPIASGSRVDWSMSGDAPFVSKVASLFMNIDKMVGDQFVQGLTALKGLVESSRGGAPVSPSTP
ncbi:MAG: polyketide cyclase [Proteobacteria bacterium]|nr:MAG: polyketide cyclase [Pseudomonadota bacterium]